MRTLTEYIHDHPLPPAKEERSYTGCITFRYIPRAMHNHEHARTLEWSVDTQAVASAFQAETHTMPTAPPTTCDCFYSISTYL